MGEKNIHAQRKASKKGGGVRGRDTVEEGLTRTYRGESSPIEQRGGKRKEKLLLSYKKPGQTLVRGQRAT